MKTCVKCLKDKCESDFYFRKDTKNYRNSCKSCEKIRTKNYYINNLKICKESRKKYYEGNKELFKEKSKKYYHNRKNCLDFKRKKSESFQKWRLNNPEKHAEKERRRRAYLILQTPKWLSKKDIQNIKSIYKMCKNKSNINEKVYYHVDHIIPLKSEVVCGLHVPWNLRIIEATKNLKKYNKLIGEL